jgi:hypothetical protein
MKFQLHINPINHFLQIVTEGTQVAPDFIMIAERDPAQEILFEWDCAYYNPLLKKNDASQLFLVNGNLELIGYNSGKAPGSLTKAERKQLWRGWFKLPPRALSAYDVPPPIFAQVSKIPQMKGVISQALRSGVGLRVPEELEVKTSDDWMNWITAQRMAVTPTIKRCFEQLKTNSHFLIFSEAVKTFLLTGVEPEPQIKIRMRYCEIRTVRQVMRELFESYEHNMEVPKSLLDLGSDAILALAKEKWGEGWDRVQDYPTGSDVVQEAQEIQVEGGMIIFAKADNQPEYRLLSPPSNLPSSVHDIFAKVIQEQEQEQEHARRQT